MCLVLIAHDCHPRYRLILASNRDEFYSRPTEPLAFHGPEQNLLCGRDLEEGGTWLAVSSSGRVAALTNVREPGISGGTTPSRGLLVNECAQSTQPLPDFLESVMLQADSYNGFNLVACDDSGLYYCSNRIPCVQKLDAGLYGLSNHQLDTPWPKLTTAKTLFRDILDAAGELDCEALFTLLRDDTCPPADQLPDTGVGPVWEQILAPIFIKSEIYGTRTSSLVLIASNGHIRFIERTHASPGSPDTPGTREYSFSA
jgi:uncharacterized protein with NRDE domain